MLQNIANCGKYSRKICLVRKRKKRKKMAKKSDNFIPFIIKFICLNRSEYQTFSIYFYEQEKSFHEINKILIKLLIFE